MKAYYYKAYDEVGRKRSGTLEAPDRHAAGQELQRWGLRPYFLHDYHDFRKLLRQREKKRRRNLIIGGAVAALVCLALSAFLVSYAGRDRPPTVQEYSETGILEPISAALVAKTPEERQFGVEMYQIWHSFVPNAVDGVQVSSVLLTIHVNRRIHRLSENDLEVLATNSVRAFQRRFGSAACSLWLFEDEQKILEVDYNGFTKSTRVKAYQ
ncbi:MAG: hypothetical protein HY706_18840 [Candidatus Hydrogenedentes bacterium]|nr:hypothetical protein [Candidatus Hydrogenedentota bacterium]